MALFNSLTFDGVNSLDSGIYITGEAVYNAPQRQVEMVTIPGRNGTLAIDQGRFENIEVTYPAGCFADDQSDFASKIMEFRNELASRFGYNRLVDTYHPDEFRLGTYSAGLEVGAVGYHRAGEFDITFDCKPQRFLVSGEEAVTIGEWGETETATGDIVEIDNPDGTLGAKSLLVTLDPIQDLHGYDHPWVGGAGKNKYPIAIGKESFGNNVNATHTTDNDVLTVSCTSADDSGVYSTSTSELRKLAVASKGTYTWSADIKCDKNASIGIGYQGKTRLTVSATTQWQRVSVTNTYDGSPFAFTIYNKSGEAVSIQVKNFTFAEGTDSAYYPYENICPISGRTEVDTIVSPTTDAEDGETYTTTLGRTVYGGTLDVVSGELVVTKAFVTYDGSSDEQWVMHGTGSASAYAMRIAIADFKFVQSVVTVWSNYLESIDNGKTWGNYDAFISSNWVGIVTGIRTITSVADWRAYLASNPLQVVYELATPQTYTLTPQQIDLLLGDNNVWSDGRITIEYGLLPNIIVNPTLFASNPLLVVTGSGTLSIGNQTLTIASGSADQVIYIDCDSQEAWEIVGGGKLSRNDYIQNAGEVFPVLNPGVNNIIFGTGITQLEITPRWWRV